MNPQDNQSNPSPQASASSQGTPQLSAAQHRRQPQTVPPVRPINEPNQSRQAAADILAGQARAIASAGTPMISRPVSTSASVQNSGAASIDSDNSSPNPNAVTTTNSSSAQDSDSANSTTSNTNSSQNPPNMNSYHHLVTSDNSIIENPYQQDLTSTSSTANLHQDDKIATEIAQDFKKSEERSEQKVAELSAKNLAKINPEDSPTKAEIEAAHKRYHEAWQNYYQKYYERYYVSAAMQQNAAYNEKLAQVAESAKTAAASVAKNVSDGTMTQQEAMDELRQDIRSKIKESAKKVRKSRHFIPAIAAAIVILVAIFVQFNSLVFAQIATFISPGDATDQSIIVGTGANQPVSQDPRIIIPKINVNAPVIYGLTDLSEEATQTALQNGPVHYPIQGASALPGQNGNTVILGHSSADWFMPGDFKFIFVQLNRLSEGDLFYLDFEGVRYTYRVSRSEIVNPNQLDRLAIGTDRPFATLITCDPVGTSLRRLLVFGEQISPDPNQATNAETDYDTQPTASGNITGAPPTLFERIFGGR